MVGKGEPLVIGGLNVVGELLERPDSRTFEVFVLKTQVIFI